MQQAVFLANNHDKDALDNGIVWSLKFKLRSGKHSGAYCYAVDITYPPQSLDPTRFGNAKLTYSKIGTQMLVETIEHKGILFTTRVTEDPNAVYRECAVCFFLTQYHCLSPDEYKMVIEKLEKLEAKKQITLTNHTNEPQNKPQLDIHVHTIKCLECLASFWTRAGEDREEQGIHFHHSRLSFVED